MIKAITLVLMLLVPSVAISFSATRPNKTKRQDKAGLEQAAKAFLEAVKAGDTSKMKGYYAEGYSFTGPDGKMVSSEERLKGIAEGTVIRLSEYSDLNIRTYDSAGVVTGVTTIKTPDGQTRQNRFTQTWVWQKGRWWIASSHVSTIS